MLGSIFGESGQKQESYMQELMITAKNGVIHHCQFYIVFLEDFSFSIFHDITDRKRLEKERKLLGEVFTKNEKILSLGRLAAGMAHEINNPLAGMMQGLYVLNNRLLFRSGAEAGKKAAEEAGIESRAIIDFMEKRSIPRIIDSVTAGGQRIANIVDNLLYFAKDDILRKSMEKPVSILEDAIQIASADQDFRNIKIDIQIGGDLPDIFCNRSKIQQVFLNILRNGTQAMTEGKTAEPCFTIALKPSGGGEKLMIRIGDNGPGMTDEVRSMIFEPFFTTREVGSGTGLGLSVCYFIITESHHGTIDVESEPGKGAIFTILIPTSGEGEFA